MLGPSMLNIFQYNPVVIWCIPNTSACVDRYKIRQIKDTSSADLKSVKVAADSEVDTSLVKIPQFTKKKSAKFEMLSQQLQY